MGPHSEYRHVEAGAGQDAPRCFRGVLLPAVARLGLSVFLFGASFLVLILAVASLISPDRFPVHLSDRTVRLAELTNEQEALQREQAMLLAERATLEQHLQAPIWQQVQSLRERGASLGAALLAIDQVRSGFSSTDSDPIALPHVAFDGAASTVTLAGEVRDPQGRSVQILAAFVDGLRSQPTIAAVTEPEYRSSPIPSGGTVTPFSLSLILQRDR